MQKEVEYLIIGQGLAGSLLALHLMEKNISFHIYDPSILNSSTMIAAGIINPLVLKRLTLSWKAKDYINYNNIFYPKIEKIMKQRFYYPLPLHKLINSDDEKYFWNHRFKKPKISSFLKKEFIKVSEKLYPTNNYEVGVVKETAWLDTQIFLQSFRKRLKIEENVTEKKINYNQLQNNCYENIKFKKLVFCEGAHGINNPYLKDLKLIGNKGNLITIQSDEFFSNEIIVKKVFILPIGNKKYKIGATYDINYQNEEADENQKELLKSQFEEITTANYKIVNHQAGIRPTVEDRRPLLGKIKGQNNYFVLNGLGSRGCLMAPLLTKELIDFIEYNKPITPECDIERFYS